MLWEAARAGVVIRVRPSGSRKVIWAVERRVAGGGGGGG